MATLKKQGARRCWGCDKTLTEGEFCDNDCVEAYRRKLGGGSTVESTSCSIEHSGDDWILTIETSNNERVNILCSDEEKARDLMGILTDGKEVWFDTRS
jgi:hypothetical protein